ncbi:hypothetical protein [Sinomicrobium weinanense]|uniref:Uncharacterized protein n=1 Tax=Sinomicrobium weinanense TaxID=2842200 RepID=A0A926Q0T9_9FLAO|nr:hypothetical protein [Sinomicrobium weinanense]MBC9795083.1 hypothetical protein [Sinomicrobium weinanense]MBU3123786.1 hypothetical protein [Sinomicrobium weinanense]
MKNQNALNPYFYTVIVASALTVILLTSTNADLDWSLAWIFSGFLLYIPLLFIKNRILRGIVIAAEYLFLLFIFWLFMMLARYEPGEELASLALFIAHSLIRLFLFLKVAGSRYALFLAIVFTLLISIPVYWYGTTDYLKLM